MLLWCSYVNSDKCMVIEEGYKGLQKQTTGQTYFTKELKVKKTIHDNSNKLLPLLKNTKYQLKDSVCFICDVKVGKNIFNL